MDVLVVAHNPELLGGEIMGGLELIEYICKLLKEDDERVYDSNIISKLRTLTQAELIKLINK